MGKAEGYLFKVTDEDVAEAKAKHPDAQLTLLSVTMDDDMRIEMITREPSTVSFQRYLAAANDTKKKNASVAASAQYVQDNLVAPAWDEFYDITQERPALVVMVANELAQGKGLVRETEKKML